MSLDTLLCPFALGLLSIPFFLLNLWFVTPQISIQTLPALLIQGTLPPDRDTKTE